MNNSKILYLTDEILMENNAPTIHIIEVCKNLKNIGLNVKLFAPSLNKINSQNFEIKYVFMTKKLKGIIFHTLLLFYLIREYINNKNIIIYIRYFPLLILPILFCKIFNIQCILEINGKIAEESGLLNNIAVEKIYTLLDLVNFRFSTKIISVTKGLKAYLIDKYNVSEDKIFIVENGVDINLFKPITIKSARKKVNLNINKYYIGYVGSLYKYQGLNYILDSVKILIKKEQNIEFIIICNGSEKEKKELKIQINNLGINNNVKIIGPINHAIIPYYINSFNICICYPTTFRSDVTSPFKLFEYLACNKAVICSDIGGLKNYFKNNILFAKPNNQKNLVNKINILLNNKSKRESLEKNGRNFIIKESSWKNVAKKIKSIIYKN